MYLGLDYRRPDAPRPRPVYVACVGDGVQVHPPAVGVFVLVGQRERLHIGGNKNGFLTLVEMGF
jgi:hypothetical protein